MKHSSGIFCNRTLNLRSLKAIGYDMDYTLIQYNVEEWERRAYHHLQSRFLEKGWPIEAFEFDASMVRRGLIIDTELGNIVKANRFGFIKQATHGTKPLSFDSLREAYSRTIVDLSEPRWVFLNTLFSLSEGCMYAQLVDMLDAGNLPVLLGYPELYRLVRQAIDTAHMEGRLKAEIIADPDRFVKLDPECPLALLDQRHAGKKLLLITNSGWDYTAPMMSYAFDRFLPDGMTWKSLFDYIIVGARKPDFFTKETPFFEVVTEQSLLKPDVLALEQGRVYYGGSAQVLERQLGLSGDEFLYVGDHMWGDVHVTKSVLRWRTALVLHELEDEIDAVEAFQPNEAILEDAMTAKEKLERELWTIKLALQRQQHGYGPANNDPEAHSLKRQNQLRQQLDILDQTIGPMARAASTLSTPRWGLLMRTGNDKSHLAFQIERYADIYTSRVSNFMHATPFAYLRSIRGTLPHDLEIRAGETL